MEAENKTTVALVHRLVYPSKTPPWPGAEESGTSAKRLLKKYPEYDLIVSGDNHESFVVEHQGRLLVNPGSMMRMTAAQIDHKPRLYLWRAKDNSVEEVFFPIEEGVVDRAHIEVQENQDERMDVFVSKLRHDIEIGFDFLHNLRQFISTNKVEEPIQKIIYQAVEED
jgi:hypothetical protein